MNTKNVLLDANLLIAAFDSSGTTSAEIRQHAIAHLSALMNDNNVALCITPLIRYEVLRGVAWQDEVTFTRLKNILNNFTELEVTRDISELAADLFRYDRWQSQMSDDNKRNLDKRKFDIFHFCSADCNSLELCSADSDIGKIGALHSAYKQAKVDQQTV